MRPGAVFLDKDGTLLVDVPYNADPSRMRFEAGARDALARLAATGMPLFVVSNQAGVARGLLDLADMETIAEELGRRFHACGARLERFYFCPHDGDGCACRKPRPGMLERAACEHGVSLADSWMVGDILDDVEAGRRAGCRTILVDNGHETVWRSSPWRVPHHIVAALDEAADLIARARR